LALQANTVRLKGKASVAATLSDVYQPNTKLQVFVVTAWAIFVTFAVIVSCSDPSVIAVLEVQG
jgi:hypothetical protein